MADADTTTTAVCQFVGDPMPDIAGLGILIGFSGQAFLSLVLAAWVFFFSRHGRLDMLHDDGSDEHEIEMKRLQMVQDILMIGNDIQVMMGTALMITVFASYHDIDIYHFRLIYDIVSFVGVSIAAALVCFTFCVARTEVYHKRRQRRATGLADDDNDDTLHHNNKPSGQGFFQSNPLQVIARWVVHAFAYTFPNLSKLNKNNPVVKKFFASGRYRATYMFAFFFLVLTIMLHIKLGKWNLDTPGACYNTAYTSAPNAEHPMVDRVYLWVTFGWMMSVMLFAVFDKVGHRRSILVAAFVQFPLHFYMMVALRTANQGLLGITAEEAAAAKAATASSPEARHVLATVARHALRVVLARATNETGTDTANATDAGGDDENSENDWDFGQTTAVLLLSVAVFEIFSKGREFFLFERKIKKKRRAIEARRARQGGGGDDDEGDERDERELLVSNAITNISTTTADNSNKNDDSNLNIAASRLRSWKHQQPQRSSNKNNNSDGVELVNTVSSSSAVVPAGSLGRDDSYDVEAAGVDRHK